MAAGRHEIFILANKVKSEITPITLKPGERATVEAVAWLPNVKIIRLNGKQLIGMLVGETETHAIVVRVNNSVVRVPKRTIAQSTAIPEAEARKLLLKITSQSLGAGD